MAAILGMFLAKFLDPISFILCILGMRIASNNYKFIFIVGIIVAVFVESILTSTQVARQFGGGLILGIPVSILHATFAYYMFKGIKKRKEKKKQSQ